ncbi:MAG: CAP domain-containing protein [Eggerthellaceae bacterium]|nr:CAP domain-containing protein [Eggerthellaceae bacterium]
MASRDSGNSTSIVSGRTLISVAAFLVLAFLSFSFIGLVPSAHADAPTAVRVGEMASSEAPGVTKHSASEVRAYVKQHAISMDGDVTYASKPTLKKGSYYPGVLSDKTTRSALDALNCIRYIAGLGNNVVLDSQYSSLAQAATLVNAVNGELSHYPSQPAGMSNELFNQCYSGASSSNLAWGYGSLNNAVFGWMDDGDSVNIDRVGHRRWILNPQMGRVGFGVVEHLYALYAVDFSASGKQTNVVWPAQTMPIEYFGNRQPWTISVGEEVQNPSQVRVTLTRSDGRTWNFSALSTSTTAKNYFGINNDGYGASGCIIFRPDGVDYNTNDRFHVKATGVNGRTIEYDVDFISVYPEIEAALLDDSYLSNSFVYTGKQIKPKVQVFTEYLELQKGTDYTVTYSKNVNVGTGVITVKGVGQFSGTAKVKFKITRASIAKAKAKRIKAMKYRNGKAVKPAVQLTYKGKKLKKSKDYKVKYKNNRKRGTATAIITGIGNFKGTKQLKFKIR